MIPVSEGRSLRDHPLDPAMFRHPAFLVLCDLMRMDPKGRIGWDDYPVDAFETDTFSYSERSWSDSSPRANFSVPAIGLEIDWTRGADIDPRSNMQLSDGGLAAVWMVCIQSIVEQLGRRRDGRCERSDRSREGLHGA